MVTSLDDATLRRGVRVLAGADPHLAAVVETHGPPPRWGRRPGFATLVKIILEQQVSLASGAAAYARLREAAGGRVTPASVARCSEARLRRAGLTRQKAAYCRDLAHTIQGGELDLAVVAGADDDEARAALMAVRGIGRWTADIYLLMALGRPDVWPDGDLALAKSMQRVKRLRTLPDAKRQRRVAAAWRPHRAVAARILWHAYLCERRGG